MINDLKDLEKLLKLCRKQGITEITLGSAHVKFGELPQRASARTDERDEAEDQEVEIPGLGKVRIPAGMTPEEFIFMSANPGDAQ